MKDALREFKADIFQALAHPTRIAILEILGDGEQSAGTLLESIGVEQANLSQHLSVLRTKHIVVSRKVGNQVFYSLRDPLLLEVLNVMRCYFEAHLEEAFLMLDEIKKEKVK